MIEQIQRSLFTVDQNTKLNQKALQMSGMSSFKVRNFLNKLLEIPDARYLEIGVWQGATFYSALYGNSPQFAVAIDNFSQFEGSEQIFQANLNDVGVPFEFINSDSFVTKGKLQSKKFNIYFYDGCHLESSQFKAIEYYYDNMDDEFIYICDDWNWPDVKNGTSRAIQSKNLSIVKEWDLPANGNGDLENWWNGLWVAILRKNK